MTDAFLLGWAWARYAFPIKVATRFELPLWMGTGLFSISLQVSVASLLFLTDSG